MSAISTASINPPVPTKGVSYSYTTPPTLTPNSLGFTYYVNQAVSVAPINGANVNQLTYTIPNIPAGTYYYSYTVTLNAVQPDIQTYFTTSTGFTSSEFFLTGTNTQYESTTGSGVFTSATAFTANVYISTGQGGGIGTPIDVGSLRLTRIA
jgi:hypothetical protein